MPNQLSGLGSPQQDKESIMKSPDNQSSVIMLAGKWLIHWQCDRMGVFTWPNSLIGGGGGVHLI